MNLLATIILSVVAELSSPGYVVYPVNDIITDPPRFNNAPNFELRSDKRGERRKESRGFSQNRESRIDVIRAIIKDELASKGVDARVFFFNGNFIVKVSDKRDVKKLQPQRGRGKQKGDKIKSNRKSRS